MKKALGILLIITAIFLTGWFGTGFLIWLALH